MKFVIPSAMALCVAGCLFVKQPADAAPPTAPVTAELKGKVSTKGFNLVLTTPDGKEIELDTDKILDQPVTLHGVMKGKNFQVTDMKAD